jgi:hypothetical protein
MSRKKAGKPDAASQVYRKAGTPFAARLGLGYTTRDFAVLLLGQRRSQHRPEHRDRVIP